MNKLENYKKGFTLIELLVVIAIIGIMAAIAIVNIFPVTKKARDVKRKSDLAQIGRFLTGSCFLPETGSGEYDLIVLAEQLKTKYPQYANYLAQVPKDPKTGNDSQSNYKYLVSEDGKKCALYANLENEGETVTLGNINAPTAGGGTGVLESFTSGWNGSRKYYQFSN